MRDTDSGVTLAAFRKLELRYAAALASIREVDYSAGYPIYPQDVATFMRSLTDAPWVDHDYDPGATQNTLDKIETATLQQICSVLTAASRAERFCDGAWKATLENRMLDPVFERLRTLLET